MPSRDPYALTRDELVARNHDDVIAEARMGFATIDPRAVLPVDDAAALNFDVDALLRQVQRSIDDELRAAGERVIGPRFIVRPHPYVPEGSIVVLKRGATVKLAGDPIEVPLQVGYYAPTSRTGDPSSIERALNPSAGYTSRTLGGRETARDRRRQRRAR